MKNKGRAMLNKGKKAGKAIVNKGRNIGKKLAGAGRKLAGKVANKARGVKKIFGKGKKVAKKLGKGKKVAKGVTNMMKKGAPWVGTAAKAGRIFGRFGRKRRSTSLVFGREERKAYLNRREGMRVIKSRRKRQLLAVGATLLGGFVFNNQWNWIKDELGIGLSLIHI